MLRRSPNLVGSALDGKSRVRQIARVVTCIWFLCCISIVVIGSIGPTVIVQRGVQEVSGLGAMSPTVFTGIRTTIWPGLTGQLPGWCWGKTRVEPNAIIIAFDSRWVVAAKAHEQHMKRWFVFPTWIPLLASMCFCIVLHRRLRPFERRPPVGHCSHCGYNLRGNISGVCPECGCATKAWERRNAKWDHRHGA